MKNTENTNIEKNNAIIIGYDFDNEAIKYCGGEICYMGLCVTNCPEVEDLDMELVEAIFNYYNTHSGKYYNMCIPYSKIEEYAA